MRPGGCLRSGGRSPTVAARRRPIRHRLTCWPSTLATMAAVYRRPLGQGEIGRHYDPINFAAVLEAAQERTVRPVRGCATWGSRRRCGVLRSEGLSALADLRPQARPLHLILARQIVRVSEESSALLPAYRWFAGNARSDLMCWVYCTQIALRDLGSLRQRVAGLLHRSRSRPRALQSRRWCLDRRGLDSSRSGLADSSAHASEESASRSDHLRAWRLFERSLERLTARPFRNGGRG